MRFLNLACIAQWKALAIPLVASFLAAHTLSANKYLDQYGADPVLVSQGAQSLLLRSVDFTNQMVVAEVDGMGEVSMPINPIMAETMTLELGITPKTRNNFANGSFSEVLRILRDDAMSTYGNYQRMLNETFEGDTIEEGKTGLARELARMNLTSNVYTQWYWKVDLHNLFHFLRLRADPHAQYEIQVFADAMCEMAKAWVPAAYEAFEEYRLGGAAFSKSGVEALKRMLAGEEMDAEKAGMSAGEWREMMAVLEG